MHILITKVQCIEDGGALQLILSAVEVTACGSSGDSFGREEGIHLNNLCGIERGELEKSIYFRHLICKSCPDLFIVIDYGIISAHMEILIVYSWHTIE